MLVEDQYNKKLSPTKTSLPVTKFNNWTASKGSCREYCSCCKQRVLQWVLIFLQWALFWFS